MSRSINDGDIVPGSLKLPESNVNSDTTFTFGLQFIKNPRVFERTLSEFSSLFLKFLNGSFIDTTALVDEMAGSGGLARVDVSAQLDEEKLHVCKNTR
jgi:hypothetical protein